MLVVVDDRRVGLIIRALRRRRGWRQVDLARAAKISQSAVSRAERGHLDTLSLLVVRRMLAALDSRTEIDVRWRGGEIDRLLDERHARLGSLVGAELARYGWHVMPEVTFMRFGERGSIDIVAARQELLAAVIIEVKPELMSYEETQRRLDAKQRVGRSVIEERMGWRPHHLATILVLADTSTNRDRIKRVEPLIRSALPAGTVEVKRWLRAPAGDVGGVWFVRDTQGRGAKCRTPGAHRVRRPRSVGGEQESSVAERGPARRG